MKVLLDTCAISELRQKAPKAAVIAAIEAIPNSNLFLSVITLGEIVKGISLLPQGKRKRDLHSWLLELELNYADQILPINSDTARIWGELTAKAQQTGISISAADGLIAASARSHGLHLMTRNVSDFEGCGVTLLNPWND